MINVAKLEKLEEELRDEYKYSYDDSFYDFLKVKYSSSLEQFSTIKPAVGGGVSYFSYDKSDLKDLISKIRKNKISKLLAS